MTEFYDICESRKDFYGHIAPAVYSTHAREDLLADIDSLPFPDYPELNPAKLAKMHATTLEYNSGEIRSAADETGIRRIGASISFLYEFGFADRHFTQMFASAIGGDVSRYLYNRMMLDQPLSLSDHAKMYQTGWFGEMINSMALSTQGIYQPATNYHLDTERSSFVFSDAHDFAGTPYEAVKVEESDLIIVGLTNVAKKAAHSRINKAISVGCPVARTSFSATPEQLEFLQTHGHVGEESKSGFYDIEQLETGKYVIGKSSYTAIDDVIWQWGDYIERYAKHLMRQGYSTGVAPTDADKVLLLDYNC